MKKKYNHHSICFVALFVSTMVLTSCKKDDVPTVITVNITNITQNASNGGGNIISASSGGNITNDGGAAVTVSGVCWSTSQNPTTANSKTTDGSGTDIFTSRLTGLTANTSYYVRAYATNSAGTAYGNNPVSFVTLNSGINPVTVTDIDGNVYQTVTIGTQVWMSENLKVTQYRDGTPIPNVSDAGKWTELTSGAYCNFNNEIYNAATYGCMYNFYAVADSRNLCPTGWHAPTDSEWTTLETFLSYSSPSPGGNLKEAGTSHWISPNMDADNSSGFTALPGGYRDGSNGRYYYLGIDGYWWSASEYYDLHAFCRKLFNYDASVLRTTYSKGDAFSVRCVKDY